MPTPLAWINGRFHPVEDTKLHVFDKGIVHGAGITEMLRTFGQRTFRVEQHLDRFFASLDAVGFSISVSRGDLQRVMAEVVEHNAALIPDSHDLGIIVFATPGTNLTYVGTLGECETETVCVHTFPLPFELWAEKMTSGQKLVTPENVRAIPPECIDPRIKHRSRLHWLLADRAARDIEPGASALVLDLEGRISETSSGNFFAVIAGEIVTPPAERCLGGISQAVVRDLTEKLGIPYRLADLRAEDLRNATEAFTSSTPYCLMPVASVNGESIGESLPGPVFQKLIAAWNQLVGVDIINQIQNGADERKQCGIP